MPKLPQIRKYKAPALDKGLDILEHLAEERLPLSQLELAQALNRTPGEIYRMLMCLEERGFVVREAASGKFRLTLRLYELGHKQNAPMQLRRAARFPMESLAEETGQACHLSVQHDASLLVLMERMPSRRVCLAVGEGTVFPLILTGSGKVLLSLMAPDDVAALLRDDPTYAALNESRRRSFFNTLGEIQKNVHHIMESELSKGVTDIAVPVGIPGTDAFGVLAISHLPGAKSAAILSAIQRTASQINQNLGIIK